VLETSVVQLSRGEGDYRLTVADIASCLGKTPAQLRAALRRLAADGFLTLSQRARKMATISSQARVAPTGRALRTLPAFADADDIELGANLQRLAAGLT
jgi:DNA-binding GntR family transcriptional regulator